MAAPSSNQQDTPATAALSASAFEANKTKEQRAEDIAYTINHALACTVTDFIDPYVGNWTQDYLGKRISIGCGHDHSSDHTHGTTCGHTHHAVSLPTCGPAPHKHGPGCKHDHPLIPIPEAHEPALPEPHPHKHEPHEPVATPRAEHTAPAHKPAPIKPAGHLKHWVIGEVVGDFGAVPVTIAFQRFAPGLMDNIRKVVEPVLGPAFRVGAKLSANQWAGQQNLSTSSKECKDKQQEIYEHEVRHLPQALIWTASSIAINLTTQRLLGNHAPLWQLAAGKAAGASISAGLVVSGRAMMPRTARNWDQATSKHIFLPLTKIMSPLAGISTQDVDRMASKQEQSWSDKVQASAPSENGPQRA